MLATAADDLTPHVLEPRSPAEWKTALRATAAIPLLAGPPVALHGRRWVDGSVSEPLPVLRALREGATHVLVLVNRVRVDRRQGNPGVGAAPWARVLDGLAPGLGSIAQEGRRLVPAMAVLHDAAHPSREGRHLQAIVPGTDAGVAGLTIDPARVRTATRIGYSEMTAAIERATRAAG